MSAFAEIERYDRENVNTCNWMGIDSRIVRGMATTNKGINKYSATITQPKSQGASQAMRMQLLSEG